MSKLILSSVAANDELRPILSYIQVRKDTVVATNGFILVVQDPLLFFCAKFIAALPEDGILLHKSVFAEIEKSTSISEEILTIPGKKPSKVIRIHHVKGKSQSSQIRWVVEFELKETNDLTFPNWEKVIPEYPKSACEASAFDSEQYNKIAKGLGTNRLKIEFFGEGKAIKVEPLDKGLTGFAIIMPIMF